MARNQNHSRGVLLKAVPNFDPGAWSPDRAPRGRGISQSDPTRLEIPVLRMPNRYQLPTVADLF